MDLFSGLMAFIVILSLISLIFLFVLWRRGNKSQGDTEGLLLLQNQLQDLTRTMDQRLGEGSRTMFEAMTAQFEQSQRLVTDTRDSVNRQLLDVARGVAETKTSTQQVFTIAEQLKNLEKVLNHQKQRGNLGERSLELALSNILPPTAYKMQFAFQNGGVVDAAIFTKEGIIPVDAKFSLDNYNRIVNETDEARRIDLERLFKNDLKARIDETAKYVRPQDGTLPFAFMYIPAEAIYYDLLVNEVGAVKVNTRNLIDYALSQKKVLIVSPTTFAAYLQSVLFGLRAQQIEAAAKDIAKNVDNLARHLNAYEDCYKKMGSSLSTTVNHYNSGTKEFGKIDKDVLRITGSSMGLELQAMQ